MAEKLLEHLGIREAIWVGHSMGGQVSLRHALHRPVCSALVLLAPAGFERFTDAQGRWLSGAINEAFVKNQGAAQVRTGMQMAFFKMPREAEGLIAKRIAMKGDELDGYAHAFIQCVRAMIREPVYAQLPTITCPVRVLFGAHDMLIPNRILHPHLGPADVADAGARLLPNAELTMVPDAGHMLHYEQPAAVAKLVNEFLATQR